MKHALRNGTQRHGELDPVNRSLPVAVEFVGPAGSGKTSARRALFALDCGIAESVNLRASVSHRRLVWNAVRVARPFLTQRALMPSRPWYRYAMMIQLQGYSDMVRTWRSSGKVALLDQGPVYLLSIIQRALVPEGIGNARCFQRYWDRVLSTWAHILHLVVALDGPDEVLRERISRRGTSHPLLTKRMEEAAKAFAHGRENRDRILSELQHRNDRLAVMRIDIGALEPNEIAREVHAHLVSRVFTGARTV